jgi:hypothetical protein
MIHLTFYLINFEYSDIFLSVQESLFNVFPIYNVEYLFGISGSDILVVQIIGMLDQSITSQTSIVNKGFVPVTFSSKSWLPVSQMRRLLVAGSQLSHPQPEPCTATLLAAKRSMHLSKLPKSRWTASNRGPLEGMWPPSLCVGDKLFQ